MADDLADLKRMIDRLPDDVTLALKGVARATAERILARARALVRVDTGYTRDNIHIIEDLANQQYIVNPGTDRPRLRVSIHQNKKTGRLHSQRVTVNMLPEWIERGTRYMPARPFMRPAGDAENDRYQRDAEAAATKVVDTLESL